MKTGTVLWALLRVLLLFPLMVGTPYSPAHSKEIDAHSGIARDPHVADIAPSDREHTRTRQSTPGPVQTTSSRDQQTSFTLLAGGGPPSREGSGQSTAAVPVKELKIAFSQYTPPYVFEDDTGIVVDIVRTALESSGYKLKAVYVPIGRAFKMFADKEVDGTTIIQESSGLKAEYSAYFMQYHNRAFALKSRNFSIRNFGDLKGKSVSAFQEATKYLGEDFARAVEGNAGYKEIAQQDAQVQMLLLGRTDVAVMDESIFRYYRQQLILQGKVDKNQEYVGFDIFPATPYRAAFRDPKVRDVFDKGIAAMRKDGRYDAIYQKYAKQYFPIKK